MPQSLANGADSIWRQKIGGQRSSTLGTAKGGSGEGGSGAMISHTHTPTAQQPDAIFLNKRRIIGIVLSWLPIGRRWWQQLLVPTSAAEVSNGGSSYLLPQALLKSAIVMLQFSFVQACASVLLLTAKKEAS